MKELTIELVLVFADVQEEGAGRPDQAAMVAPVLGGEVVDGRANARRHLQSEAQHDEKFRRGKKRRKLGCCALQKHQGLNVANLIQRNLEGEIPPLPPQFEVSNNYPKTGQN